MVEWTGNEIEVNGKKVSFPFAIAQVIAYEDTFFVLLDIPETEHAINNIYCLDASGRLLWQSEDLGQVRKGMKNLPYEAMELRADGLYAADFYGRHYRIDLKNGKILNCSLKK